MAKTSLPMKNQVLELRPRTINSKGFTLIEILIVLAIIAAIMMMGLSRIQRKDNNVKSVVRNLAVLAKETRNQARLTGSTFRLVINMDRAKPQYWVEKAGGIELRDPDAKEEDEKKSDEKPKNSFEIFKKLTKKEQELPKGLHFKSVEILGLQPFTEGVGYIYFSPEGFTDAAALQITDDQKINWTLVYSPLTGHVDILTEAKSLKDVSQ